MAPTNTPQESRIEVVDHDELVKFVVTGPSDIGLVVAHIDSFFLDRDDRCVLWNLVGCDLSTFSASQFPRMVAASMRSFKRRKEGAKTGILVGSLPDRFLLRAFAARSATMNALPLKVFEEREEAIAWVTGA